MADIKLTTEIDDAGMVKGLDRVEQASERTARTIETRLTRAVKQTELAMRSLGQNTSLLGVQRRLNSTTTRLAGRGFNDGPSRGFGLQTIDRSGDSLRRSEASKRLFEQEVAAQERFALRREAFARKLQQEEDERARRQLRARRSLNEFGRTFTRLGVGVGVAIAAVKGMTSSLKLIASESDNAQRSLNRMDAAGTKLGKTFAGLVQTAGVAETVSRALGGLNSALTFGLDLVGASSPELRKERAREAAQIAEFKRIRERDVRNRGLNVELAEARGDAVSAAFARRDLATKQIDIESAGLDHRDRAEFVERRTQIADIELQRALDEQRTQFRENIATLRRAPGQILGTFTNAIRQREQERASAKEEIAQRREAFSLAARQADIELMSLRGQTQQADIARERLDTERRIAEIKRSGLSLDDQNELIAGERARSNERIGLLSRSRNSGAVAERPRSSVLLEGGVSATTRAQVFGPGANPSDATVDVAQQVRQNFPRILRQLERIANQRGGATFT